MRSLGFSPRLPWKRAFILPVLLASGCNGQPQVNVAEEARQAQQNVIEEARRAQAEAQGHCIETAFNNTFSGHSTFAQQNLRDCPADFVAQFVATGSATDLLVSAESELSAHLAREDAARQESAVVTISDLANGKLSGSTPWIDWESRKRELETVASQRRREYGEAKATLLTIAARYGVTTGDANANATADGAAGNANTTASTM